MSTEKVDPATDEEVAELKRAFKNTTPGPWAWDNRGEKCSDIQIGTAVHAHTDAVLSGDISNLDVDDIIYDASVAGELANQFDARFIVAFFNLWPKLLARLEAVEEEVAELRKWDSRKMLRTRSL